jgi:dephospho-CoA kinase
MLIGVTGNIASGKSTVAKALAKILPAILIDADKIAHDLYDANPELLELLVQNFGPSILECGKLSRYRLGQLVFSNSGQLELLNKLVHPKLKNQIGFKISEVNSTNPYVILDAALIFEWKMHTEMDLLIQVRAKEDIRLKRLMARSGLSQSDALSRIHSQKSAEEKWVLGTKIIYNDGSLEDMYSQIDDLVMEIRNT